MKHAARRRTDPAEERARILEVAEEHFRRVGYRKTSVTDIAAELGMSAANVYRFFPSKEAIKESVCMRVMDEAADIAARPRVRARGRRTSSPGLRPPFIAITRRDWSRTGACTT